jgi:flavin-dependent dehydrogenase
LHLARRGLTVACLEAGELNRAGARWVNVVPAHFFETAAIPEPTGEELVGRLVRHRMYAGQGPAHLAVSVRGLLEVDMRLLVARLQAAAKEAGARFYPHTRVTGWDGRRLHSEVSTLEPRWVVDASGLGGARLLDQPAVPATRICQAAQEVREVVDPAAARAFFARHEVGAESVVSFTMLQGGFSSMTLGPSGPGGPGGDRVSLLAGSVPALGFESGSAMLARFVAEHPWIGPRIFGGSRAIPLRRPYACIGRGRVALLGDAACQVFAAHGSGTGVGLVAARMLAEALADGRGIEGYATAFQRRFGGLLAIADEAQDFMQGLTSEQAAKMIAAGLINDGLAALGVQQRPALPEARGLLRFGLGIPREPVCAARLLRVAAAAAGHWVYHGLPRARRTWRLKS